MSPPTKTTQRRHTKVVSSRFGIEVPESITFSEWEPGNEYTKTVTLKNTHFKMQRVKLSASSSPVFSAKYDESAVKVSAGTSISVPVTFRPFKKTAADGMLRIQTPEGVVKVKIRATLPRVSLRFPDNVSLGVIAFGDSSTIEFALSNPSPVSVTWTLSVPAPFTVTPNSGELAPGAMASLSVLFKPTRVSMYEAVARLKFDAGVAGTGSRSLRFTGLAKFPYLALRGGETDIYTGETKLNFDSVFVGDRSSSSVVLFNPGKVSAVFSVEHSFIVPDARFRILHRSEPVASGAEILLKVVYTPLLPNEDVTEHFDIVVPNGIRLRLSCHGTSNGPKVTSSIDHLTFNSVPVGQTAVKHAVLRNHTDTEVNFQILGGGGGVFTVDHPSGVIGPLQTLKALFTFAPHLPIQFYRKITLLVQHQAPIEINLIGTSVGMHPVAFMVRDPLPLTIDTIKNTEVLRHVGLAKFSPSQLAKLLADGKASLRPDGRLTPSEPEAENLVALRYSEVATSSLASVTPLTVTPVSTEDGAGAVETSELTASSDDNDLDSATEGCKTDVDDLLTLSLGVASFGACPSGSKKLVATIPNKTVSVTNSSSSTMEVSWVSPGEPFSIQPTIATLASGEIKEFYISFRPAYADRFYSAEIECFGSFVEIVQHEQAPVKELFRTCPTRAAVRLEGHTFPPFEGILPKLIWETHRLEFAPSVPGEESFASVLVKNAGLTAVTFDFGDSDCIDHPGMHSVTDKSGVKVSWSCSPQYGRIEPDATQLLTFRIFSHEAGSFEIPIPCAINDLPIAPVDASSSGHPFSLVVSVCVAALELGNSATVYLSPTRVGASSSAIQTIRNTSLVPVIYKWDLENINEINGVLSVEPTSGIVQPNEEHQVTWRFSPSDKGPCAVRVPCTYSGMSSLKPTLGDVPLNIGSENQTQYTTHTVVVAEGQLGNIAASPRADEMLEIPVMGTGMKTITLHNANPVKLQYILSHDGGPEVVLDHDEGTLPSRCRRSLVITCSPSSEWNKVVTVFVSIFTGLNEHDQDNGFSRLMGRIEQRQPLCRIGMSSVSPRLKIIDARTARSSKGELWDRLSLTAINNALSLALQDDSNEAFRLDFGSAVEGSSDTTVKLVFENPGPRSVSWNILFPTDLVYNPEPWAERDNLTKDEEDEQRVQNRKIFEVSPRSGRVDPGEQMVVTVVYRHGEVCKDRLTAFLRLAGGSELLLNFIGETLHRGKGHLHIMSDIHRLQPVMIGSIDGVVQHLPLRNTGDDDLVYKVNNQDFKDLQTANYGFKIFECSSLEGTIPPGGEVVIPIRFLPIEAKQYSSNLLVYTGMPPGIPIRVTIVGEGYDPRVGNVKSTLDIVPSEQSSDAPWQRGNLSIERLYLGQIAAFSITRRAVYVVNRPHEDIRGSPLSFEFDAGEYASVTSFDPPRGVLLPGQSVLVIVTFMPRGGARQYDFDAMCRIIDEDEVFMHRKATDEADTARQQAKDHFTLTDKGRLGRGRAGGYKEVQGGIGERSTFGADVDLNAFPAGNMQPGFAPSYTSSSMSATIDGSNLEPAMHLTKVGTDRPSSATRLQKLTGMKSTTATHTLLTSTKYVPLPPINIAETRRVRTPAPLGRPRILYLGIRADVCSPDALKTKRGNRRHGNLWIDRSSTGHRNSATTSKSDGAAPRLWANDAERDTVEGFLCSVVQDILDDDDFVRSLATMRTREQPVFFQQLGGAAVGSADQVTQKSDSHGDTSFLKIAEELLSGTIANILKEVDAGEFDVTARTRIPEA